MSSAIALKVLGQVKRLGDGLRESVAPRWGFRDGFRHAVEPPARRWGEVRSRPPGAALTADGGLEVVETPTEPPALVCRVLANTPHFKLAHPYHGSAAKRRANPRPRRSRGTVDAAVLGSVAALGASHAGPACSISVRQPSVAWPLDEGWRRRASGRPETTRSRRRPRRPEGCRPRGRVRRRRSPSAPISGGRSGRRRR